MTQITQNARAFLDMLAYSEGTDMPGHAPGYDVIVGSTPVRRRLLKDFSRHPNVAMQITSTLWSTAAGRYQFIYPTWIELQAALNLPDFGGASQDAAALELIRRRGALELIDAGKIHDAINVCASIWASLPGAGYGQRERSMADLLDHYKLAGGSLA